MSSLRTRTRADGSHRYEVLFRHQGRQRQEPFDDPAAAARWKKLLDQVDPDQALAIRAATTVEGVPTLRAWLAHHIAHATHLTPGTAHDYQAIAERTWLPALGDLPVDMITRDQIAAWIGRAHTGTPGRRALAVKTLANARGLLHTVLASAVEAGHVTANPVRGVRLPKGQRKEMEFLTETEFVQLLDAVDPRHRSLVSFFAGTGLRWGEATALTWSDVDLDATTPTVRVHQGWQKGPGQVRTLGAPKTSRSTRTVSLPTQVVADLRTRTGDPGALVFPNTAGGRLRDGHWRDRVWTPAVTRALPGRKVRILDLRHTHASWLIAAGVPLPVIQRRLGHESITTTVDRYGHLAADAHAGAAAATPALEP